MATSIAAIQRELLHKIDQLGLKQQCMSDGDINAQVAIVAEAPGMRECELKLPLVGSSGKLLWTTLARFGMRRQHFYITNVVKRQLVDEGQQKEHISRNELEHWKALLKWELEQLPNIKYILILGGRALEALIGVSNIDDWRGTVNVGDPTYIIANNPAHIMRTPMLEPIFTQDIAKLDMVMRGQWQEYKINHLYDPSPREAVEWCDRMIQEGKPVGIDIETIAYETACVGLANDPHEGMCINFRGRSHNRWTADEEIRVRRSIQRVVRHPNVKLVAQNGAFDAAWLWYKDRIQCKPIWIDTLLAHHTLHPTWPHRLGFLTTQYTTHPFYKDDGKEWREGGDISTFWMYNVKDTCIILKIAERLHKELIHQKMDDFFFNHVMRLQPHLIRATVLGNKVDLAMRERLNAEYSIQVDKLANEFKEAAKIATGDLTIDTNPNSPTQLKVLFFNKLNLVGRGASTDAKNREAIIKNPRTSDAARNMLYALNRYLTEHKLYSTYISSKVDEDGRMRSDYKQYGTQWVPGRLSSSQTLWGSGMNLQNQPERLRNMFIADDDACFVYFDGAQAEARIVAYEANIPSWKHQFEQARLNPGTYDAHIALASEMFNVPYDEVPKYDYNDDGTLTYRGKAKRCRHGLNYRMQYPKLAEVLGCSLSEAQSLWNAYHRTTPELEIWWRAIIQEVQTTRQLFTCLGRRMEFLGSRLDDDLMDSIIAFKPQSTLGDFVCSVQYKAQEDDEWPTYARIPFNNHDSLTAMCRMKDAGTVARIMRKYAEAPLTIKGEPLIIPADFKISYPDEQGIHRWNNLKKLSM